MTRARNLIGPALIALVCFFAVPGSGSLTRGLMADTLTITKPLSDDHWVSGGQDTIRWSAFGVDEVDIFFSTNFENGVGNFTNIVSDFPTAPGEFIWTIPGGILSRDCAIYIRDGSNPSTSDTSGVFSIKGSILTRIDVNGDYDAYVVEDDSWDFENTAFRVWPSSWWSQFNYVSGTDPFTGETYSGDFQHWSINADSPDFPDWPSFVRAFGTSQTYLTVTNGGVINPWALLYWALNKRPFIGESAGFAGTDFLAWDDKAGFLSRFNMQDFVDVREIPLASASRRAISHGWCYQLGVTQREAALATYSLDPVDVLQQIKDMFQSETTDNRGLMLFDVVPNFPPVIAHAINPWKVELHPTDPDIVYVYAYDSNAPGLFDLRLEVNTNLHTWRYSGFQSGSGLGLMTPSSSFLQDAALPLTPIVLNGGPSIEIYNSFSGSTTITNSNLDAITYNHADSVYTNTISGSIANTPPTGVLTPPTGYILPVDAYSVVMSDFVDPSMHLAVFADSIVFMYAREDATPEQEDMISYMGHLGVRSPDPGPKNANMLALVIGQSDQRQIDFANLAMVQNDSLDLSLVPNSDWKLVNVGSAKSYDLSLKRTLDSAQFTFHYEDITLDSNSSHGVYPDWAELETVTVYIDLGNDGTVDDTLVLGGTVSVDDTGEPDLPVEYSLQQNYPNPFNPATAIRYHLASQSHVTLRVYDILGREVTTLVNGIQEAGSRSVTFDAGALSSGVYYYQIDARGTGTKETFRDIKKMMLVK